MNFEDKVLQGLKNCGVFRNRKNQLDSKIKLGIGISGGADSVSLLLSLVSLSDSNPFELYAVTVNHFMRPDEETCSDAEFVVNLCKSFVEQGSLKLIELKELKRGSVENLAKEKQIGPEAAARALRYNAFSDFIESHNLDYFCLGHNKNDQLETVLMRFLQGAFVESKAGIPLTRDKYIRPLLNISRNEIEVYLKEKNQPFCTDATNNETVFARNKIRQKLIPVLNEFFPGWDNSVISGSEKDFLDGNTIKTLAEKVYKDCCLEKNDYVEINRNLFLNNEQNLQIRVFLLAMNKISNSQDSLRIPYGFLKDVCTAVNNKELKDGIKIFNDFTIQIKNQKVLVKKGLNTNTELFFSAIIEEDCTLDLPWGSMEFIFNENQPSLVRINDVESEVNFVYPFCVRSIMQDDYIQAADGSLKKVSRILSDWHVSGESKDKLLVMQELSSPVQKLICILGKHCGFKDWILKN